MNYFVKETISDNTFDDAICKVKIQMVINPEALLKEIKRIFGHKIIFFLI